MKLDRAVTARSNGDSPFIYNKTSTPGWGLAEGRRQKAMGIAKIAIVAKIGN
ncbi:MAG TPA: hypothetical protein VGK22_09440 [Candidatus Angelobacter sp.]